MGVIGLPVLSGMPHRDSATEVPGGVVDQSLGDGPSMMPDYAAGGGVQRVGVVGRGRKHDAVYNHRCDLQAVRIAGMEYPLRSQLCHVAEVDLRQITVAAPREIAVIGKPVCSRRVGGQLGWEH